MNTPVPPKQPVPGDDKRLERLYDYTKFHIGIYLSVAGGIATLLGSKDANFAIATLIGCRPLAYLAFGLLVLAGMCGGIVATSVTESATWDDFWSSRIFAPATVRRCSGTGEKWVAREHGFFWAALLTLAAAILIRADEPKTQSVEPVAQAQCCCARGPDAAASAANP